MKKFAFISTNSIKDCYKFFLNKQRGNKYIMDILKISVLSVFLMLCGFFYLRFVSLASTEWYFLRKANNELAFIHFEHEVIKTELLDKVQNNREKMYGNSQTKKIIDIRPEVVKIPNKSELSYR